VTAPKQVRDQQSKHGTRLQADKSRLAAMNGTTPWAGSEFAEKMLRARWDTHYFAEELLGINAHPGQDRIWDAILKRESNGWSPRYLTICCAAGNRAGKTLGIAIAILHSTIFKLGMEPPNPMSEHSVLRWVRAPYEWYHLAIAQETSELAYISIVQILQGIHEAQKNGCPLTELLGRKVAEWDKKYRGEYLWLQLHPVLGGGNIHFRTTGEKAIGSLGKDMHGISYDEAGFDQNFDFVVNEVLHMRRMSTGGQFILISTTTEGITGFADKWEEGNPEQPDRKRDSMSVRMSTRENIGFGISQQNFDRMVEAMPEELVPQNIDGFFVEGKKTFFGARSVDDAFVDGLPELISARKGHTYKQGVDPALTFDSTWSIVLDVSNGAVAFGVSAARIRGRTTGPAIAGLTTNQHLAYSGNGARCESAIDATGFGGKMFRDLLDIPVRSIEFGGTAGRKLKLLNNLKSLLEQGKLKFPRTGLWLTLRRQLLGYRYPDKNLETDAVMALAVACTLLALSPSDNAPMQPLDYFGTGEVQLPPASRQHLSPLGGPRRWASYTSVSDMNSRTEG